jgi:hypothetical protein
MLKPSRTPSLLRTSEHWATGSARALNGRDPSDPTGWSIRRGDTSAMAVDGSGVMSMGGPQPRFYIMPKSGETQPFFRDIEFTGYYRRTASDGAFNAGFVVGMRSHPKDTAATPATPPPTTSPTATRAPTCSTRSCTTPTTHRERVGRCSRRAPACRSANESA